MATLAEDASRAADVGALGRSRRLNPTLIFWLFGLIAYGGAATEFATGHFVNQVPRDLWQHLAALKALIADPVHPLNPFVPTAEVSRHFHPYWVGVSFIARALGWNEWQALAFAGFLSAGVLLAGIQAFARTFYRDPWGPVALLAAMTLGWILPVSHTGYHSPGTLIEGIGYPAALLIGLSFLLWAAVMRALEQPRWNIAIALLAALMFATHPLGAGIGFIVASCFIALWPDTSLRNRVAAAGAIGIGLVISTVWPLFNPFETIRETGNASWEGGAFFYAPLPLITAFVPQALGIAGLRHEQFGRRSGPVLVALIVFIGLFALGLSGIMIAMRFLMPAVLMLHIGLGALLLVTARNWPDYSDRQRLSRFAIAVFCLTAFVSISFLYLKKETEEYRAAGSAYDAAQRLTSDIPDMQPIAAWDVDVWPVVATGQRALSVPWPEPGIRDLAERQRLNHALFDPALTRDQRVSLAKQLGVRTLILDRGGPLLRPIPPEVITALSSQAVHTKQAGPFLRFDLY